MGYDFSQLRVLYVDDNEHMRHIVKAILRAMRIGETCLCGSVQEALDQVKSFEPDLVITDWEMTPLDGLELVRCLRDSEQSHDPCVPIILLSAHTQYDLIVEALEAGVNEILAKPVSPNALHARLVSLTEKPRPFVKTDDYFGPDHSERLRQLKGLAEGQNAGAETGGGANDEDVFLIG